MINFIIYEDEKKYRDMYITVILKMIGRMKSAYRIVEIDKYQQNTLTLIDSLVGKKIFILDVDVPGKSGLDLVHEIRNNGDWLSQMIIVTEHEHLKNVALNSKMLMLDFISKFYNCEESLKETLKLALNIINHHQSLNFQCNGELYQVPYNDILFIEKNVEDSYSTIVTKKDKIQIKEIIGNLEEELTKDERFFRTHRSCIVNIDNITSIELKDSIIHFGKVETPLLSRDKKRELKSLLCKDDNHYDLIKTNN